MGKLYDIIDNIGRRTIANVRGTPVLLDSYTTDDYVFPSDGYLSATCGQAGDARASASLRDSRGVAITELGGVSNATYATWVVFVKKGMRVRVSGIANNGHVYFYPMGAI